MRQIKPARAEFEKIITDGQQSFHWKHLLCKQFGAPYHYHPEFELIHIARGRGRRLVGDSIGHFGPDDLVLIAPNVPHIWQVAPECSKAETLYIQFLPGFPGPDFFQTPEMRPVRDLLNGTRAGVTFNGAIRKEMTARLIEFPSLGKPERLLALLDILLRLSQSAGIRPLGKPMSPVRLNRREEERISRVFTYLNQNLSGSISQAEIARSVRLSSSAFSRLFKKTTGKCFMQVVNELRIAQVCRLLAETNRTISEIAFGCGFESLSSFHCQFRRIMKTSPGIYRQKLDSIAAGKNQR
ncbi:MAG: AraC family transcriptional regulator [Verrucomicrobiaceae bacterium]|nr:MAG: AraC family transcriptional regulator [Verrucomicrobiaceae bacterium]